MPLRAPRASRTSSVMTIPEKDANVSTNDRVTRPEPERTQPIRSWSTLFEAPGRERGPSLGDVVSRSVDLGYRVVDEYVRQGQRAAERVGERSYGAEAIASDVQQLTARMSQYASDFLSVWFEFLELAMAGSAARGAATANGGGTPAPDDGDRSPGKPAAPVETAGERTRVRIEVVSGQPAEVELDLRPGAERQPLVIHALRDVDPSKPRLTDVHLRPGSMDEPLTVRVRVPLGQ